MSVTESKKISAFDEATETSLLGKLNEKTSIYVGKASNKWSVGDVPNGGYVLSIITDGVLQHFSDKYQSHPVALNSFFLNKTEPGHLILEIEEIKMSRKGYCITQALLKQRDDLEALKDVDSYNPSEWKEKVRCIFTMGNMDHEEGITHFHNNPLAPSLEPLEPFDYMFMGEFVECTFDKRVYPQEDGDLGKPEVTQTMKFVDGRPIDFKSISYWCDMFLAPPFLLGPEVFDGPVWCPTMQLEILFKRKPTGQKIIGHLVAPHIINGRFDASGEIWDENGEILALTRHQNLIVSWSRNSKDWSKTEFLTKKEKSKI